MSSVSSGRTTFIASEVIPTGVRVKYLGNHRVGIAGARDKEIGVSGEQQVSVAIGDGVEVLLDNEAGTRFVLLAGAATDGVAVRRDVLGKVSTAGAGSIYGIALQTGVATDLIEVLPLDANDAGNTVRTLTFIGRNLAGAVTLTGAVVGDVVQSIAGITTAGNASALFESTITVADQIQQVSATDLSAKTYVVSLASAS